MLSVECEVFRTLHKVCLLNSFMLDVTDFTLQFFRQLEPSIFERRPRIKQLSFFMSSLIFFHVVLFVMRKPIIANKISKISFQINSKIVTRFLNYLSAFSASLSRAKNSYSYLFISDLYAKINLLNKNSKKKPEITAPTIGPTTIDQVFSMNRN